MASARHRAHHTMSERETDMPAENVPEEAVSPEELEKAKVLLYSLLQDCGERMRRAEASRRELEENLEKFRRSFEEGMVRMNLFQQEEMRARLRKVEREAREYDELLHKLRREYDWMTREYSGLCK